MGILPFISAFFHCYLKIFLNRGTLAGLGPVKIIINRDELRGFKN
jgi:hypothetical protein